VILKISPYQALSLLRFGSQFDKRFQLAYMEQCMARGEKFTLLGFLTFTGGYEL
jgi:hypothetical protein